jgi:hypothetical protein
MEDGDSGAEMADYGTDFSDDVDPNFDATEGMHVHNKDPLLKFTLTPILCRRIAGGLRRQMAAACSPSRTLQE